MNWFPFFPRWYLIFLFFFASFLYFERKLPPTLVRFKCHQKYVNYVFVIFFIKLKYQRTYIKNRSRLFSGRMIFVCILVEPLWKNPLFQIINVSQKVWWTKPLLWMNNLIGALQMFWWQLTHRVQIVLVHIWCFHISCTNWNSNGIILR